MLEKLAFMMRFWDLSARQKALGAPLSSVERIELFALLGLMATDDPLPAPGRPPRSGQAIGAQVAVSGSFVAVEVRMVCAQGVVVAAATALPPGTSTVARLADDASRVEYTVPCLVEWSSPGSPAAMALRVDGAPARRCFVAAPWLSWGATVATPWAHAAPTSP
jgi:hypothetical protein